MKYMCLIYDAEGVWDGLPEDERNAVYEEYGAFTQSLHDSGAYVSADQLQPIATATTVRVRNGETLVTDGPFAETKEQLGGYYLIECKDIDEATKWAAKCPSATIGSIEVRPVMTFPQT